MSLAYEHILRPLLFRLEAEKAHELAVDGLRAFSAWMPACRLMARWHRLRAESEPVRLFGLEFPNRVGLAAGFDKDALCWPAAAALGFGHVEIGTVTQHPQPGNPRPRLFRCREDRALINRMGFNNAGAAAVAERLARRAPPGQRPIPLGINLGKSRVANLDEAAQDYLASFALLADHADYIAINVSSPNTPDLRKLQEETRLNELLRALAAANRARPASGRRSVPLLVKIAPDLSFRQIDGVVETVLALGLDGIIATNTTIERPGSLCSPSRSEAGGLSGAPLRARSNEVLRYLCRALDGRLPVIGVGGVEDGASASEKLDAGAALVQVYTGMIFRGPFFAAELARALSRRDWATHLRFGAPRA